MVLEAPPPLDLHVRVLHPKHSVASFIKRRLLHDLVWHGLPQTLVAFGIPTVPAVIVARVGGAIVMEAVHRRAAANHREQQDRDRQAASPAARKVQQPTEIKSIESESEPAEQELALVLAAQQEQQEQHERQEQQKQGKRQRRERLRGYGRRRALVGATQLAAALLAPRVVRLPVIAHRAALLPSWFKAVRPAVLVAGALAQVAASRSNRSRRKLLLAICDQLLDIPIHVQPHRLAEAPAAPAALCRDVSQLAQAAGALEGGEGSKGGRDNMWSSVVSVVVVKRGQLGCQARVRPPGTIEVSEELLSFLNHTVPAPVGAAARSSSASGNRSGGAPGGNASAQDTMDGSSSRSSPSAAASAGSMGSTGDGAEGSASSAAEMAGGSGTQEEAAQEEEEDSPETVAMLAHELGHLLCRHGPRQRYDAAVQHAVSDVLLGAWDAVGWLGLGEGQAEALACAVQGLLMGAGVLGQLRRSGEFEGEADQVGAALAAAVLGAREGARSGGLAAGAAAEAAALHMLGGLEPGTPAEALDWCTHPHGRERLRRLEELAHPL